MAAQSISRDECQRTHEALTLKLSEMHEDIKMIRDNHIPHITETTEQKWKDVTDKMDAQWKWIFIVAILSGVGSA